MQKRGATHLIQQLGGDVIKGLMGKLAGVSSGADTFPMEVLAGKRL